MLVFPMLTAALLSGCSIHRAYIPVDWPDTSIELTNTPFFPQDEYQCGPAAVAMLLGSSGVFVIPDMLTAALYIPKRQGALQLEILGTVRRHNRIPYQVRPEIGAVVAELRAGRPVLVLQNLGLRTIPTYHYAVAVGALSDGRIVLRSGSAERLVMELGEFEKTWKLAGSWGIVALQGDEMPADHDIQRFLRAIADIEETGNSVLAEQAYTTVLTFHPYNETALFGIANALYVQKHYTTAATFFAHLLRRDPYSLEVANNLAESLAALQCYTQALELLDSYL